MVAVSVRLSVWQPVAVVIISLVSRIPHPPSRPAIVIPTSISIVPPPVSAPFSVPVPISVRIPLSVPLPMVPPRRLFIAQEGIAPVPRLFVSVVRLVLVRPLCA